MSTTGRTVWENIGFFFMRCSERETHFFFFLISLCVELPFSFVLPPCWIPLNYFFFKKEKRSGLKSQPSQIAALKTSPGKYSATSLWNHSFSHIQRAWGHSGERFKDEWPNKLKPSLLNGTQSSDFFLFFFLITSVNTMESRKVNLVQFSRV